MDTIVLQFSIVEVSNSKIIVKVEKRIIKGEDNTKTQNDNVKLIKFIDFSSVNVMIWTLQSYLLVYQLSHQKNVSERS